jgi:diguanylate cyclase (GGDEF)-like protein/putative nucleotidyltransferase with HDIG domain
MENRSQQAHTFVTQALWSTIAVASVCVIGVSLIGLKGISPVNATALALGAFIAAVIGRHDIRILNRTVRLQIKDVIALWGITWLGVPGGVLIALAGSAASCYSNKFEIRRSFLICASDSISTFIVGSFYYFILGYFLTADGAAVQALSEHPLSVVAVNILLAGGHFFINSTLSYVGRYVMGEHRAGQLFRETFLYSLVSYLVTIGGTILVNYVFLRFGLEFGLVLLPIVVLGDLAYAVHRRRLESKTREITVASRIHLATVEALATAIDARDQLGGGHVRRTQIFAVGIGTLLGLKESDIDALRTASLLHDIGKLAVPDHILNKPEELTHAEEEKMKIHSSVGASILEKVGFDTPVVPTVKYHHENWDGTGYPEALRGENIPLTARILSVADAYDSYRSPRSFRQAVTRDEACKLLRRGSSTKFDPRIVKLFLENLDRLEAEATRKGLGYDAAEYRGRSGHIAASQQNYIEQIKLANREAFTMYELAKDFSSSLTLDETLKLFTDKVREFVHFDTCAVYLLDKRQSEARSVYASGKHASVFVDQAITIGEGVTGGVLQTQIPASDCDPDDDLSLMRLSVGSEYHSMISVPIHADDKLVGAVSLYSASELGYTDEHLRLVETISQIAADAIIKSQRHAETESHALTDPMTGLPNARSLQIQFEREIARAQRTGGSFQILMLDLDGFKQVNDTFGHKAGDKMLQEIGRIIKSQFREYDFLARYAGDEFVALIPNMDSEGIYEVCRRVEQVVSDFELRIGDDVAQVGVSIGWSTYPYSGQAFDQLLIAADREMYATKSRRKQYGAVINKMIPKPTKPLEFDMPVMLDADDIDTVVEIDEHHIYLSPLG